MPTTIQHQRSLGKGGDRLGNPLLIAAAMNSKKGDGGIIDQAREEAHDIQRAMYTAIVVTTGFGAAVFTLWYIDKRIKKARSTSSINKGDDYEAPQGFALRFSEAMDGLGTNEDLAVELANSIPHRKFWDDVQRAYAAQTQGRNLINDLRSELSDWWFQKVLGIIAMKPATEHERKNPPTGATNDQVTQWANSINDAAEYTWGTDEDALVATLAEIPTVADLRRVDAAYRAMYGYGLLYELTDELSGDYLQQSYDIITSKPDANGRPITQILR
jgi:hypothetical protein